ncbi:AAA family ATPase [Rhodococcus maanshanensis]|uniref:ATPase AAA-type core domain-containing protein n=1 Tax=Rhodococcus maanshanensis TaxID=183556 RepID=A0A1H7ICY6_9NOCA|nr:ATP-binding protein [Rhodococcus maanshanensis]SEK60391.1 hypothetical protein SAMN05444583_102407 [Rhodococcus maanshanensis]
MLVSFGVENHRSIRERMTLDLRVGRKVGSRIEPWDGGIAPIAAIYGANASGKSSLWSALDGFLDLVRDSYRTSNVLRHARQPFALDSHSRSEPTSFDIEFVADDGILYGYSVSFDDSRVIYEELVMFRTARPTKLFERVESNSDGNSGDASASVSFGNSLAGPNRAVVSTLREDSLFLSAAYAADHPRLKPVTSWLRSRIRCYETRSYMSALPHVFEHMHEDRDHLKEIIRILEGSDVGILDGKTNRRKYSDSEISRQRMLAELFGRAGDFEPETETVDFTLVHRGEDGNYELPFEAESEGTQALIAHANVILFAMNFGGVVFFDEIDSSLHPEVVRHLVQLFSSRESNPHHAQLIFTTHDVSLMASIGGRPAPLSREHLWFTEKGSNGTSVLYPVTDFGVREEDNVMRRYMTGRYGALPQIDLSDMGI